MRERILNLLAQECPDIDFTASDKLVDDGILDSLTITSIIVAFTVEFGVTVPYEEIVEDNFNSVDGMAAMIERLQG